MKWIISFYFILMINFIYADDFLDDDKIIGSTIGAVVDEHLNSSSTKILKKIGKHNGTSGVIGAFIDAKNKNENDKFENDYKRAVNNANYLLNSFMVFRNKHKDKKIYVAESYEIYLKYKNDGTYTKKDDSFSSLISLTNEKKLYQKGYVKVSNNIYPISKEDNNNDLVNALIYFLYNSCYSIEQSQWKKIGSTMQGSLELSTAKKYCRTISSLGNWSFGPEQNGLGLTFFPEREKKYMISIPIKVFEVSRKITAQNIMYKIKAMNK